MAYLTITFPVTLLIETDSPHMARLAASMWSVSMTQATHGVELQQVPKEIRAVSFNPHDRPTKDVTADFEAYVGRIKKARGPEALDWAKAFGNFNVGLQPYWDNFEFDREQGTDHSEGMKPPHVRYLCTHCGAWRETDPSLLIASLVEGAQPGSDEAKAINDAKKSEAPFMVRHMERCGPKGGIVRPIYPDEPEWEKLDPKKRED